MPIRAEKREKARSKQERRDSLQSLLQVHKQRQKEVTRLWREAKGGADRQLKNYENELNRQHDLRAKSVEVGTKEEGGRETQELGAPGRRAETPF